MKKFILLLLLNVAILILLVPFLVYEALKGLPGFLAGYIKAWKHANIMFIREL